MTWTLRDSGASVTSLACVILTDISAFQKNMSGNVRDAN